MTGNVEIGVESALQIPVTMCMECVCVCDITETVVLLRVSSVWCKNLHSGVLLKAPHACEKVLRTFDFSTRFSKKYVFY